MASHSLKKKNIYINIYSTLMVFSSSDSVSEIMFVSTTTFNVAKFELSIDDID